jgi:hypothetical protein
VKVVYFFALIFVMKWSIFHFEVDDNNPPAKVMMKKKKKKNSTKTSNSSTLQTM